MVYKIVKYIERNHKFNKEKGREPTIEEIAKELGMSQVQVSRNEQKVLRKLRDKLTN